MARLFEIQFPTKNFLRDFSLKCRDFDLFTKNYIITIFCGPLLARGLLKIPFHTKNFLRKFFNKMHRFRLIYQKLSEKCFFVPLLVDQKLHYNHFFGPLLGGAFVQNFIPYKNSLGKFFIKIHRFRLIHQKLSQKCVCAKFNILQKIS